jgi:lysophospholipase L1-like esterase
VIRYNEAFVEIAVDTQTDIIFLQEEFCGHGFNAANPEAPCYRGPDTEVWFDFTCIHPNPAGHARMAEMFEALVAE